MRAGDYLQLGKELILTVLGAEHACSNLELAARISDAAYPGASHYVEPPT